MAGDLSPGVATGSVVTDGLRVRDDLTSALLTCQICRNWHPIENFPFDQQAKV
ncbi:hypothetical protein [Kitasatospora sp. McL0602]|uniref:hypothetical protein n=1 Tax=Kitasatospora sp. McL0602 TaxID=3439530 RepID=UPI003F891614